MMFGVKVLTQIFIMEFNQTNKETELLVFEGYGYIRHRHLTLQMTNLLGAAVLQNAITVSGYAMKNQTYNISLVNRKDPSLSKLIEKFNYEQKTQKNRWRI